ncbi:hypothetical protein GCM10025866_36650 [Naasia aerilata]|uniref:Uncharacterized protein n=1 Tax=Naasia aerilata TaxID=1162966 RepID=A0ABM8GHD1_9MICO|nr:hypothetical protein GCM10025866_36650 [Naasia aerilata]
MVAYWPATAAPPSIATAQSSESCAEWLPEPSVAADEQEPGAQDGEDVDAAELQVPVGGGGAGGHEDDIAGRAHDPRRGVADPAR